MASITTSKVVTKCCSSHTERPAAPMMMMIRQNRLTQLGSCAPARAWKLRLCKGVSGRRPQSRQAQFTRAAAVYKHAASPHGDMAVGNGLPFLLRKLNALYQFSRPHTMLGTFTSVISVSLLALGSQPLTQAVIQAMATALVPALLMNVCIVGLNQLFDVDIDKVNKPYLPLASGALSMRTGVALCLITGVLSIGLGIASNSRPLLATLVLSLALGVAYSTDLPFLRWKRYPALAAMCILAVRSVFVQLGFFFHMKLAMGAPVVALTRPLVFAISFMFVFSIVIALFKDIPDVKGDAQAGVRTFSVRAGVRPIFWTCIALMELAYASAIGVGLASPVVWSRWATVGAHALMGSLLLARARRTDLSQPAAISSCYMFVWKLFYAEYLLIPLLR